MQALSPQTVIAGGGCVVRRSDDGGQSFRRIAFTNVESACKEELRDFWFVDPSTGWILETDGTIVQTKDGGTEFIQRTAVPGTEAAGGDAAPTAVTFITAETGFAAASNGKLYMTTDAGVAWKLVADTGARALRDVEFVDAEHGFGVGARQLVLHTEDGGVSWSAQKPAIADRDLDEIDCATRELCIATTVKGDQLVRTADGGEKWSLVAASTDPIFAASFASETLVSAAGASGTTVVSQDAGAKFGAVGARLTGEYFSVRAGGRAGTAYAPGRDGALAVTRDGGATWIRGNVATSEDLLEVSFPTAQTGYALDTAGGVFRTQSGGQAWSALDAGAGSAPLAIIAPAPDTALTVGRSEIRRSSDGGESFARVRVRGIQGTLRDVDVAGAAIVAYGDEDVFLSTDAGVSWKRVKRPGFRAKAKKRKRFDGFHVSQVDFIDARQGFALTTGRGLWFTRDQGRSWRPLEAVGTRNANGMAFSSAKAGYLVVDRFGDATEDAGFLLRTTDGGASWRPQFVVRTPIGPHGVATSGGTSDYLLGGGSAMLSTTTGGDAGAPSALTISTRAKRLKRPRTIKVSGKLQPASGFERVTVSRLYGGVWKHTTVKAASNGSFTTNWKVRTGVNGFVAQWAGDFKSFGAGSKMLTVRVKPPKAKGKRK